ncbi:Short-chain dehydrogenase/reductase SDR [Penicillium cf. griseofulvum]|uniref:Short-chain dehydrogenase/reductase SDR n=1 Tax=Penicillium cf. griseofulvum TaxID=2972120 RepID=A0A9W9M0I7_9EURO|nr:Short-chain dehydrogenase/reductase SDR [Penicillium cf. griseofulvum]KAJ5430486.1 Short-chain dehydrogenase/reductase SDR [Penicillium cf. griseofulvum]KAJ5435743.1 Short-chain dehydrogenase/reductase SDR [Penicillium cf. griseofulvum]
MTISDNTVVFVTGASRGIGRTLVETFLLRPKHTIIASVRDTAADYVKELVALPKANGSHLQVVKIESSNPADPAAVIKVLTDVDHIDIVVANAGGAGEEGMTPLDAVSSVVATDVFAVNTLGPLALYQAVKPLLERSQAPKWISVSSAAGSIGRLEVHKAHIVPAYGIAKAGLNWLTTAIHSANKDFIAFAVHPGLVQTDGGNKGARAMGLPQAPITQRQSIDAILGLIDNASREATSGKFFDVIDGTEIPW